MEADHHHMRATIRADELREALEVSAIEFAQLCEAHRRNIDELMEAARSSRSAAKPEKASR